MPVGELVDDLHRAGFSTEWITDPDPDLIDMRKACGRYHVPKPDGPVAFAVRREWSPLEGGRGFMVAVDVNDECVVTNAEVAWMLPNTF